MSGFAVSTMSCQGPVFYLPGGIPDKCLNPTFCSTTTKTSLRTVSWREEAHLIVLEDKMELDRGGAYCMVHG
jgi:hypothetical protein